MEGIPAIEPAAMEEVEPRLSPLIRALSKYQLLTPGAALLKAERVRAQLRRSVAAAFEHVDALAWPTLPAPAPPIEDPMVRLPSGEYPADYANVRLGGTANLTGVPAISVPCGLTARGPADRPPDARALGCRGAPARPGGAARAGHRAPVRRRRPPVAETTAA